MPENTVMDQSEQVSSSVDTKDDAIQEKKGISLTDLQKATILLLSLPEETATSIFARLTPQEFRRVKQQIEEMDEIDRDHLQYVYAEFLRLARGDVMSLRGGDEYLRRILGKVKGEQAIREVFGEEPKKPQTPLEKLQSLDPNIIANVLINENPQTTAVIMSQTEPELAAAVIELLPHDVQVEVLKRLATLSTIPRRAMEDIERVLDKELAYLGDVEGVDVDGIASAADVVKYLDYEIGEELLAELEEDNPEAVSRIRRAMFTFEDLEGLDTRGWQALLKEITNDQLLMALKGASEELRDKILGALSKRAAQMLLDDLEIMPPQRLSDVERAQQEIVEIAMRLEAEGKIQIAGHGGEQFV